MAVMSWCPDQPVSAVPHSVRVGTASCQEGLHSESVAGRCVPVVRCAGLGRRAVAVRTSSSDSAAVAAVVDDLSLSRQQLLDQSARFPALQQIARCVESGRCL